MSYSGAKNQFVFINKDPGSLPNPKSGEIFFGSYQNNLWKKTADGTVVYIEGTASGFDPSKDETITGIFTFESIPKFFGGESGSASPFEVDSDFLVSNLNAQYLNGNDENVFAKKNGKADDFIKGDGSFSNSIDGGTW